MNIQAVSPCNSCNYNPAHKASYVTLCEKNYGERIAQDVIGNFNTKILPELRKTAFIESRALIKSAGAGRVIMNPEDYRSNVNFFTLAGGSGSRFSELAQAVGDYNKMNFPFKIGKDKDIHILDFVLTMGKYFIEDTGVNTIMSSSQTGSFGDIISFYQTNAIKDTIVCCGDNVFGDSAFDIMGFFTKEINNPNKHLALVGTVRTPEEVAKRFGVLEVEGAMSDEVLKLKIISEKPELETAQALAIDGQNIANTGLFYISKEAMEKLMAEIQSGANNIRKNDTEKYELADTIKYVHSMIPQWFGRNSSEGADVKIVEQWEDVGEPKALYRCADSVKKGLYINDFPKKLRNNLRWSFAHRVHLDPESEYPYINFSKSLQIATKQFEDAKEVEGVNIII